MQRGREQLKEMLLDFCEREFGHTPGTSPCPYGLVPPVAAKKPVLKRKLASAPEQTERGEMNSPA